jgi:hypothetical protein
MELDKAEKIKQTGIAYAPKKNPVKGTFQLCVIGIKWANKKKFADRGDCKRVGNQIRKFYLRNSRELVEFKVKESVVRVPF